MRTKVTSLLAAAFSLGVAHAASAADMPTKAPIVKAPVMAPAPTWTGCYVGIEGGGNWGSSSADSALGLKVDSHRLSGGLVGGTLGCNYQVGTWVLGVEGDYSWTNKDGSENLAPGFVITFSETAKERWISTLRGRVGYAFNNGWLIYATGGGAWARFDVNEYNTAGTLVGADSHTMSGGTVGGGIEWMFAPRWSAKAEYLYVRFSNKDFLNGFAGVTPETRSLRDNIFRVGLNYKFWTGP